MGELLWVFLWLGEKGEAAAGGVQGRAYRVCSRDRHRAGLLREGMEGREPGHRPTGYTSTVAVE